MPVAPELENLLAAINALPPMHQTPIAQLRKTRERIGASDIQPVGNVVDRTIPGPGGAIPLRLYAPAGDADNRPLVMIFHGGGFVFGGIDGYYDHVCRVVCAHAGCCVIAVAYRLAPEDKFPAATDDCYAALQWAVMHGRELGVDTAKVFVAGGSAGANLAAVTALRARQRRTGTVWPTPVLSAHRLSHASDGILAGLCQGVLPDARRRHLVLGTVPAQ